MNKDTPSIHHPWDLRKYITQIIAFRRYGPLREIIFLFAEEEKKSVLLVLPIEEISIRPELSRPPRFRIQGGGSLSMTYTGAVGVAGQ